MKKRIYSFFLSFCLLATLVASLSGCGKSSDEEITNFMNNMSTFYSKVSEKNELINNINAYDSDSATQLLDALDSLNEDFIWLDSIPVPQQYGAVDQFANEGMQYMNEAVKLYHQAFNGDSNYENILVAAKENYRRANLRLAYISDILQGNEPDIESVSTTQ